MNLYEPSRDREGAVSERGFALLLIFVLAASVALMLYTQMPRVAFESERDKEQLLIDRGEQYKRAIQLFYQDNRRFPGRMEDLGDLDALRAVLRPLAEHRLVVYLSPEGRRGTMLTHGFHDPEELARLRSRHAAGAEPAEAPPPTRPAAPVGPGFEECLAQTNAELTALRSQVTELQATVAGLTTQVQDLRALLEQRNP